MRKSRIAIIKWLACKPINYLDEIPMMELAAICQALGQSGKGTREELKQRVQHEIWKVQHTEY